MSLSEPLQCETCKHYQPDRPGYFCAAFPDEPGIPLPIIEMDHDHRQPHAGDHGIRWEPIEPGTQNPFDEAVE